MIKRIPLILFCLSVLSFIYMLVIRLSALGTKPLFMGSKGGKFVASNYYSSVILFVVILALFIASVLISHRIRSKRRHEEHSME